MTHTLPPRYSEHAGQHFPAPTCHPGAISTRPLYNPVPGAPIPYPPPPASAMRQPALLWTIIGMALVAAGLVAVLVAGTGGADRSSTTTRSDRLIPAGDFTTATVEPTPDDPDTAPTGGSADEVALHRLVDDFIDAAVEGPTSNWKDYYCAADRAVIARNGNGEIIVPTEGFTERTVLSGVEVSGATAHGLLDAEPATFRKESGQWTFCMTAQ